MQNSGVAVQANCIGEEYINSIDILIAKIKYVLNSFRECFDYSSTGIIGIALGTDKNSFFEPLGLLLLGERAEKFLRNLIEGTFFFDDE
jgi:hypothetical protein